MNTTVQFRIDRPPKSQGEPRPEIAKLFPIPVWIYWPATKRTDYRCSCSTSVFRVTEQSARELMAKLGQTDNAKNKCVCPCIGEVIE